MKKRFVMFVLALVLISGVLGGGLSASAHTQQELLDEFATIPATHWVYADIENLSKTMTLTQEQCDKLWPLLQEVKQLVPTDNGPSVYVGFNWGPPERAYDAGVVARVLDLIREACRITGCTFVKTLAPVQTHDVDIVFNLYDPEGKLIFQYDGDLIKPTGSAEQESGAQRGWLLGAGIGFLAVSAVTAVLLCGRQKKGRGIPAAA